VLVVVLGVLGYKKFIAEPKAEEARNAIWKAEYYFEIDSLDLAMNGDGNFMGMQAIADAYGSTPSGELAHFYLGTILMQKGDYQGAIDNYKQADPDDDVLRVMAVGNQGDALVELGKVDEALAQFEKAAARAFGRVAKDFSSSPDAMTARKLAARAEQMASNG
jgi:tetratricopeptide (TPR) repeat protein